MTGLVVLDLLVDAEVAPALLHPALGGGHFDALFSEVLLQSRALLQLVAEHLVIVGLDLLGDSLDVVVDLEEFLGGSSLQLN